MKSRNLAPIVGWLAGVQFAFVHGLWLPLVTPVMALAVPLSVVLLLRFWIVEREGRAVKEAFRHYLAPELVNILAAHPEQLTLGGETRLMTIMFCDIRGFTSISERGSGDQGRGASSSNNQPPGHNLRRRFNAGHAGRPLW